VTHLEVTAWDDIFAEPRRIVTKPPKRLTSTGENYMKLLQKLGFSMLLIVAMAGIAISQDTGAKQDMKDAGHETKDAAKDTGSATKKTAKKTGHAVKHTTKKVTHKAAEKTDEGAQRVEDKTAPQ
jgi:hypothetical protein